MISYVAYFVGVRILNILLSFSLIYLLLKVHSNISTNVIYKIYQSLGAWILINILLSIKFFAVLDDNVVFILNFIEFFSVLFVYSTVLLFISSFNDDMPIFAIIVIAFSWGAAISVYVIGFISRDLDFYSYEVIVLGGKEYFVNYWSPLIGTIWIFHCIVTTIVIIKNINQAMKNRHGMKLRIRFRMMQIGYINLLLIGLIVGGIGTVEAFYEGGNLGTFLMVYVYGMGIFPVFGLLFLILGYFRNQEIQIFNLEDIDTLFIVNQSGLPYYSHSFHNTHDDQDSVLATSALSALGMFLENAFAVNTKVSSINFKDKVILIEEKSQVIFILVCSKKTRFLSTALKNIMDRFISDYSHIINNDFIQEEPLEEFSHFVNRKFGMT